MILKLEFQIKLDINEIFLGIYDNTIYKIYYQIYIMHNNVYYVYKDLVGDRDLFSLYLVLILLQSFPLAWDRESDRLKSENCFFCQLVSSYFKKYIFKNGAETLY